LSLFFYCYGALRDLLSFPTRRSSDLDRLSFGLAVYTPYGSKVDWDQDWAGSHLVNNIDLKAFFIQPTASFKLTDNISVGAGLIRSEEHTSELQSRENLVCRLLLEKKK